MLPRCVIVEGPTAVGKGTFIRRLAASMAEAPDVMHFGRPPRPDNVMDTQAWYALAGAAPLPRIVDRWLPSNTVYARVFGNQKSLYEEDRQTLEAYLLAQYDLSVSAIILVGAPEVLRHRHSLRGGGKPTSDPFMSRIDDIVRAYSRVRFARIPYTFIRTDNLTPDEVFDRGVAALETKQR